ncbi:uncharacterized protein TNIN_176781 [Trichonephila inaurata madagascariensis]|uniref:H15 domain-containing protein n=1 Tax=Trichonephila inaurata madagascariensis TaxID=2747483 RepID=A0A8X7BSY4_9ARAC|nr:uncharacterized protein TNIN_176781 [Trichonephila inaurata madagascariensis]
MSATKDKRSKSVADKHQIRRWILKSVAETTRKTAVTLNSIKKFLDSKQKNVSGKSETKMILKRLLDSGHLVKADGRFFAGKANLRKKNERSQSRKSDGKRKSPSKSQRGKQVCSSPEREQDKQST